MGPELRGRRGRKGATLWSGSRSGAARRAQLHGAVRASDPQLAAPQPLPKMFPAVVLLLILLVEQAGKRVW